MKFLLTLAFSTFAAGIFAQIDEDFSGPSLEKYAGTTGKFALADETLALSDNAASTAYLSAPSECIADAEWTLDIRLKCQVTSANYVRYYLVSDSENLGDELNGYFVQAGGTKKNVSLVRQNKSAKTTIIDGTESRLAGTDIALTLKVTRSADGNWQLFSKIGAENDFVSEGEILDTENEKAGFCGIFVAYSKTNAAGKFAFDNWHVSGQKLAPPYAPAFGDIVFSEIMVNPTPSVSLPEEKYIEITNRTGETISTKNLLLCDASKKYAFPADKISAGEIVLLCEQKNAEKFADFGHILPFASFPYLTESGKLLWIEDENGNVLAWVEYSPDWHKNAFKAGGGWSLECVDLDVLSGAAENWTSSADKRGGTPAKPNSVQKENPDKTAPKIISNSLIENNLLKISFSEPMDEIPLKNAENYIFSNGQKVVFIIIEKPKMNGVTLTLDAEIAPSESVVCTLKNQTDLAGNVLENASFSFSQTEEISENDLIVNEFLFGQKPDGLNFIELFNRSGKTLDLSDVLLCSRGDDGELSAGTILSAEKFPILSGSFVVICSDRKKLCAEQNCAENAVFVAVKSLSGFSTDGGEILLVRRNSDVVNAVPYSAEMCGEMTAKDSKSIERTDENSNDWHTSSQTATPGFKNSEKAEETDDEETETGDFPLGVSLAEKSFSPNGDGHRDELQIRCRLAEEKGFVKIDIYNAQGALVVHLSGKTEIGGTAAFAWDGRDKNGDICPVGLYVVYAETQTQLRGVKRYKLPFAVTLD